MAREERGGEGLETAAAGTRRRCLVVEACSGQQGDALVGVEQCVGARPAVENAHNAPWRRRSSAPECAGRGGSFASTGDEASYRRPRR